MDAVPLSDGSGLYIKGDAPVLITVPHATPPENEPYLKGIATELSGLTRSHALIGGISRKKLDLSREEGKGTEFRARISGLKAGGLKLILDLHGAKYSGMFIGTVGGKSASDAAVSSLKEVLKRYGFAVTIDHPGYSGSKPGSIASSYAGPGIEVLQLEIGHAQRAGRRREIIEALAEFISGFTGR